MPVFEMVVHFEKVDDDDVSFCRFVRTALNSGLGLGKIVPDILDVKVYFRDPNEDPQKLLVEKLLEVLDLARRAGLKFKKVGVSGWCNGDDSFCKPYWNALHEVKKTVEELSKRIGSEVKK